MKDAQYRRLIFFTHKPIHLSLFEKTKDFIFSSPDNTSNMYRRAPRGFILENPSATASIPFSTTGLVVAQPLDSSIAAQVAQTNAAAVKHEHMLSSKAKKILLWCWHCVRCGHLSLRNVCVLFEKVYCSQSVTPGLGSQRKTKRKQQNHPSGTSSSTVGSSTDCFCDPKDEGGAMQKNNKLSNETETRIKTRQCW
jgi:hypothetical protein